MSVTDEPDSLAHGQLFPLMEKHRKSEINLIISSSFTLFPSLHASPGQAYPHSNLSWARVPPTPAHTMLWDAAQILQAIFSFHDLCVKAKNLFFPTICFVFMYWSPYVLEPRRTQKSLVTHYMLLSMNTKSPLIILLMEILNNLSIG